MSTDKSRKEHAKKQGDLYRDKPKHKNKSLSLSLPLPPSVNHMYITLRSGKKMLTRNAQDYIRESRALINLAIEEQFWQKQEYAVWLYVDLVFYMPDRRIRDSHNMLKLLLDVMQDVVFDNDYFIMPRINSVEYDEANPRVEVRVSPQLEIHRQKGIKTSLVSYT